MHLQGLAKHDAQRVGLAIIRQGNFACGGECLAFEFHARYALTDMVWIFDRDLVAGDWPVFVRS